MKFIETNFKDCYIIEIEKKKDNRGFFARSWDSKIFEEQNLDAEIVQCNISFNLKKIPLEECIIKFFHMKNLN